MLKKIAVSRLRSLSEMKLCWYHQHQLHRRRDYHDGQRQHQYEQPTTLSFVDGSQMLHVSFG